MPYELWRTGSLALLLVLAPTSSFALSSTQIRAQLDELIAHDMLAPLSQFRVPTAVERDELARLLGADSRVVASSRLTKELVLSGLYEHVTGHRTTLAEAQVLAEYYLNRIGSSETQAGAAAHLTQLLLPYAKDAGLCTGDALSEEGVSCAFTFVPGDLANDVTATGSFSRPETEPNTIEFPTVENDTPIHQVLTGCQSSGEECSRRAQELVGEDPQLSSSIGVRQRNQPETVMHVVARLLGIRSAHAQTFDQSQGPQYGEKPLTYNGVQVRFAYATGYYFRVKCSANPSAKWWVQCEIWGEIYLAGAMKYLVTASDNLMIVLPIALFCPTQCVFGGMVGYAASAVSDKWLGGSPSFSPTAYLEYAAWAWDRVLRGGGSYVTHTARGACGVIPMPYQTRPSHEAISAFKEQVPFGDNFEFEFRTSFQIPPTNPLVPLLSTNMDPVPTSATAELPQVSCNPLPITINFVWRYDFLQVVSWNANMIFSGLDNLNVSNYCGADELWTWHGQGSSRLPTVDWSVGFAGGHLPYLPVL